MIESKYVEIEVQNAFAWLRCGTDKVLLNFTFIRASVFAVGVFVITLFISRRNNSISADWKTLS
jgi:preprotein translocase subunit SecG